MYVYIYIFIYSYFLYCIYTLYVINLCTIVQILCTRYSGCMHTYKVVSLVSLVGTNPLIGSTANDPTSTIRTLKLKFAHWYLLTLGQMLETRHYFPLIVWGWCSWHPFWKNIEVQSGKNPASSKDWWCSISVHIASWYRKQSLTAFSPAKSISQHSIPKIRAT